ncbi:MAG: mechanosensitive ion channel family protein [Microscillaceae bacterium]|jgi:small-conductance mechanosensitive channel|nr:mechanosensitive ion channel family protein [Microscillaceae bacterium]
MKEFFAKIDFNNVFLENLVVTLIILLIAYLLSWLMRSLLDKLIQPAMETLAVDPTNFNFFKNAVSFTIYTFAVIQIFFIIPALTHIGTTLFAGAGILAAIVGFASQAALSNIISGMFIVIFKPFRVGDFIKINNDTLGTVEDITLRHVIINGPENRRIVIPNSIISTQTIINSTLVEEKIATQIDITLAHEANIDQASQIMQDLAQQHPDCFDNRSEEDKEAQKPVVTVRVIELKNDGFTLRATIWAKDSATSGIMKSDLLKSYKEAFEQAKIPFPNSQPIVVLK